MVADFHKLIAGDGDHERMARLVASVTHYAIYLTDPEGIVRSWNVGARKIMGYTADEIIGRSFDQFFTPEDREAGKPQKALSMGHAEGHYEEEGWRVRKDGSRFWAFDVLDAILDDSGHLLGFAKVVRDVTARRAMYEALRESERRFRLLVEGVTDYAIFMLDPSGRITNWNAGAERIKGYPAEEIIGRHFSRFYTESDREAGVPDRALRTAAREGRFESEGWRVRKDGTLFWAHALLARLLDESGRIVGFAKVTRDMTERRKAQEELEKAQEQLHQSQKLESLGRITGGIAHDFNNILTAVLNNIELAQKGPLGGPQRRRLKAAMEAAKSGASLVQQLLIFARKQPLRTQRLDVQSTIDGFFSLMRQSCPENIAIRRSWPPTLRPVNFNSTQLQSCVLNLVVNARDAMPEGGEVTISATDHVQETDVAGFLQRGRYVCISVSDNGQGMSSEVLERALDPFFTTKGSGKGSGLGLSIVHNALDLCGGAIAIESKPGAGTVVRMYLPAWDGAESAPPKRKAPAVPTRRDTGPRTSGVILYVEDELLVRLSTDETLKTAGHRTMLAPSGEAALEILASHPEVDLVITDIGLPGMSGRELVARCREFKPDLKVLFLTGYDQGGVAGSLAGDPRSDYLDKPYGTADLLAAVEQLLRLDSDR